MRGPLSRIWFRGSICENRVWRLLTPSLSSFWEERGKWGAVSRCTRNDAMPAKVLDSFALIAYFRDEPGAEAVETLLIAAGRKDNPVHMTDVNYAEVKYSIVKKDGAEAW